MCFLVPINRPPTIYSASGVRCILDSGILYLSIQFYDIKKTTYSLAKMD